MDFVSDENQQSDFRGMQSDHCMVCSNELNSWEERQISVCDHCVSKAIGDQRSLWNAFSFELDFPFFHKLDARQEEF